MEQKASERPIIRLRITVFSFLYMLVKFHTFGLILKKSATVTPDFHFRSDCVISYIHLSHVRSTYGVWCLMKHDHSSWLRKLSNTHSHLDLLPHTTGNISAPQVADTANTLCSFQYQATIHFLITRILPSGLLTSISSRL
jgi:hypothetical protein